VLLEEDLSESVLLEEDSDGLLGEATNKAAAISGIVESMKQKTEEKERKKTVAIEKRKATIAAKKKVEADRLNKIREERLRKEAEAERKIAEEQARKRSAEEEDNRKAEEAKSKTKQAEEDRRRKAKETEKALRRPEEEAREAYQQGGLYYDQKKYTEAAILFRKAAEHGHVDAQFHLGACYRDGNGVDRDYKEAIKEYIELIK
jgi:colicin import membrane protein